jgi:low affinity Fe/Cu permease
MNRDCEKIQEKIKGLILGALSRRDEDAVTDHTAGCSECKRYLQALRDEQCVIREFAGKVEAGMQQREERMLEAIKRTSIDEPMEWRFPKRTIERMAIAKMAVAATLLIAAGYVAGHYLASPSIDIERLQAALEPSIRRNLQEQFNHDHVLALERHTAQLKEELAQQFYRDLNGVASKTLMASRVATEERLIELIELIEAARAVDHMQVATAFKRMEANRLQDRSHIGENLIRFATQKNNVSSDNKQ